MKQIIDEISKIGIIPVIALDDAKDATALAKALLEGGIPAAEITFRTAAAEEAIRLIAEKYPEMLVGAGTVLTAEMADKAVSAGAKFIVSPGLNPLVVRHCLDKDIPIIPGCSNPSDVEQAIALGLDTVKFFPAEACGGLNMIKSMAAPYTSIKFMPTGGINAENLNSYLSFDKIVACGGSWMVNKKLIAAGEFNKIKELTRQAVDTMLGFSLAHVGVNTSDESRADALAQSFSDIFGFDKKAGSSSVFAGTAIEAMKSPYLGKNGHIAIATNSIKRAVYHLERRGVRFDESTAKTDKNGCLSAIYIKGDFEGFAVHLVQKK